MTNNRPTPILVEHAQREIPRSHHFDLSGAPHPCRVGALFADELFRERRISSVEWELLRGGIWPRVGRNGPLLLELLPSDAVVDSAWDDTSIGLPTDAPQICREAVEFAKEAWDRQRVSCYEFYILFCAIWPRNRMTGVALAKFRATEAS